MILSNRKGIKSIGLIDYQNAKFGNNLYDLISFLYDCRVLISNKLRRDLISHYIKNVNISKSVFNLTCKILIVQRNLKILGNFTKAYLTQSNPYYLKYLSNVWNTINNNLDIEPLEDIKGWLSSNIC